MKHSTSETSTAPKVPESIKRKALSEADCVSSGDDSDTSTRKRRWQFPNSQESECTVISSETNSDHSHCCHSSSGTGAALQNKVFRKDDATVTVTPKRATYLSWDDYFMSVAVLSSKRSKDPDNPSGACIVDEEHRIVGIGYNGFPRGCDDEYLPWASSASNDSKIDDRTGATSLPWLHTKDPFVCHAVANAILNKCSNDVARSTLYVMNFPCSECAKVIIQSRIQEVVILHTGRGCTDNYCCSSSSGNSQNGSKNVGNPVEDEETIASRIMLDMAGIRIRFYKPAQSVVSLDFESALSPADETAIDKKSDLSPSESSPIIPEKVQKLLWDELKYDPLANSAQMARKHISWQDYFMGMAFLTAQRSKDPNTQVGACVVDSEKRIVGLGYNGFPRGCSDDVLPWARSNLNALQNKYLYVCHAEVNAIMNKGSANLQGTTLYVALFPCQNCAKMIIQAGIREVVYMSDRYHDTDGCRASRTMFQLAKVKLVRYIPSMKKLTLEFAGVDL